MNSKLIAALLIVGLSGAQNAFAEQAADAGRQVSGYYGAEVSLYEEGYDGLPIRKQPAGEKPSDSVGVEQQGNDGC